MAFGLGSGRPVADEIRRIAGKQLKLAIGELNGAAAPNDGTVHEARRHIKKARATLRLCRDALRPSYRSSNRRLRRATRLLAPIADGEAVIRTFDAVATEHAVELPAAVVARVRRCLHERQATIDQSAERHHVLERVVDRLQRERDEMRQRAIPGDDYRLLAPGFERTIRRSQSAMTRAMTRSTADHYHAWRRRVKDHWLQTRLLNQRCDGHLAADAQRLDRLDALLGRCHDLTLLASFIQKGVPLTRAHAAACLRVIGREQWAARHAAVDLGHVMYDEPARITANRAAHAWHPSQAGVAPREKRRSCPRVA